MTMGTMTFSTYWCSLMCYWHESGDNEREGRKLSLKRILSGVVLCACSALLAGAIAASEIAVPPYPSSTRITDVSFNWPTHICLARGSDNWPITWADDGHQYTSWGDGGGFGGTNSDGRVSNGFGRVEGPKNGYLGVNIAGGKNAPYPAPFDGKCYGIISIDGTLYAWRTGGTSGHSAYTLQELWKSTNHAATWSFTGVRFVQSDFNPPADRGFFAPTFLEFGRDYAGARDEYVYSYATNVKTSSWEVHRPGQITLMRVPKTGIENRSGYEFFAGMAGGNPQWTSTSTARRPVWEDATNGVMRISVSYNAPLKRYFLWTEHTARNNGNVALYEAPEPWGPWRTVFFDFDFASQITSGKGIIYFGFSSKWLSVDGRDFVAVMSVDDNWDTVEGRFTVEPFPLRRNIDQDGDRDPLDVLLDK